MSNGKWTDSLLLHLRAAFCYASWLWLIRLKIVYTIMLGFGIGSRKVLTWKLCLYYNSSLKMDMLCFESNVHPKGFTVTFLLEARCGNLWCIVIHCWALFFFVVIRSEIFLFKSSVSFFFVDLAMGWSWVREASPCACLCRERRRLTPRGWFDYIRRLDMDWH
jgi:hypothetical protein